MGSCCSNASPPSLDHTKRNEKRKTSSQTEPLISKSQSSGTESYEKKERELIDIEGYQPGQESKKSNVTTTSNLSVPDQTGTNLHVTITPPKPSPDDDVDIDDIDIKDPNTTKIMKPYGIHHQKTVTISNFVDSGHTLSDLKPFSPDDIEAVGRDATLPLIIGYDPKSHEPSEEIDTEDGLKQNDIPHATVKIPETMSKLFLTSVKYEKNRNELVDKAKTKEYVDNVIFDVQKWIIVSANKDSIESVSHMLDIVAVRLPVIKLWQQNSWDDYKILMDRKSIQYPGIWDVMGLSTFARDFVSIDENSEDILDKLLYISNQDDDFLKTNPCMKWKPDSEEYKTFYDKLTRIRPHQTYEIIILGDKESVERLILDIRQSEIEDPSMAAYIKKEVNPLDPEVIFAKSRTEGPGTMMEVYGCVLQNIPKHTKDSDLIRKLDQKDIKTHTCTYFTDKEKNICAKIQLATRKDMEKLRRLCDSKTGFEWRKRIITIKTTTKEKKKRKIRRVTSGSKLL